MDEHTTHFDDCGCKSAKYEAVIERLDEELTTLNSLYDGLNLRNIRLKEVLRDVRETLSMIGGRVQEPAFVMNLAARCQERLEALGEKDGRQED